MGSTKRPFFGGVGGPSLLDFAVGIGALPRLWDGDVGVLTMFSRRDVGFLARAWCGDVGIFASRGRKGSKASWTKQPASPAKAFCCIEVLTVTLSAACADHVSSMTSQQFDWGGEPPRTFASKVQKERDIWGFCSASCNSFA